MRKTARVLVLLITSLASAIALAGLSFAAPPPLPAVEALIMGGTGRPNPDDFPLYMQNVRTYYIEPNTACAGASCESVGVFTPEEAFPLYGGPTALTWKNSILQGVTDFDTTFRQHLAANPTAQFVLQGYSQSGEILAIEKRALADDPTIDESQIDIVVIGNSSRPNGGIDTRLPFSIPIVDFPYGPPMPTDTEMDTTDIGFKWDPISDLPLYVLNPLAMINALLGFEYIHGTFPDPADDSPDSTPGGYSVEQWQDMMDHPENYPDLIDIQTFGDTKYITVTPKILPVVQPLHDLGLTALADLIEPALRVIIEQTGYDRSIPYGQPTPGQLFPVFDPIQLITDLGPAVNQGIQDFMDDLGAPASPPTSPVTTADPDASTLAAPEIEQLPKLTEQTDLVVNQKKPDAPSKGVLTDRRGPTLSSLVQQDNQAQVKSGNLFTPDATTAVKSGPSPSGSKGVTTTTTATENAAETDAATPGTGAPSTPKSVSSAAANAGNTG